MELPGDWDGEIGVAGGGGEVTQDTSLTLSDLSLYVLHFLPQKHRAFLGALHLYLVYSSRF